MDVWSIASVERDTGLSKELLRMWERRYGFPRPLRDAQGDRLYPAEQVDRLRVLKRLLDAGHRPGRLLALSESELQALAESCSAGGEYDAARQISAPFVEALAANDFHALRRMLEQQVRERGLRAFVLELAVPLTREVGTAWYEGRLAVHQEHLYSEELQNVLRQQIKSLPDLGLAPRVLLTTPPNELHGLGLLMVEALLRIEGADVRGFGLQLPLPEIAAAARQHRVDIVGLSFSASFPVVVLRQMLRELDEQLPEAVELWIGGAAARGLRKLPQRVHRFDRLDDLPQGLRRWRRSH